MDAEPPLPTDEDCAKGSRDWPHAPPHRLQSAGVFIVTARAAEKRHLLAADEMKDWFQDKLHELALEFGWRLEAWAILSNHYHFVGHSPPHAEDAASLSAMVRKLHSLTTKELNHRENKPGRTRLWQNFRETHLTHQPARGLRQPAAAFVLAACCGTLGSGMVMGRWISFFGASRLAEESGSRLPQSREYSPGLAFRIVAITPQ